jgi:hypothetical protein
LKLCFEEDVVVSKGVVSWLILGMEESLDLEILDG